MLPHPHAPKWCSRVEPPDLWGSHGDHTGTICGSLPYLSPILSWCPIFSLGTKAACQHPTEPSQHEFKPEGGSEHGVLCHILPLPYVVLGSLSLSILGEPQSQTLFPLLTFLPFRPGLPSSPGLPWEEKKGSEGAPQALHQPEAAAARGVRGPLEPQGAWKGELGSGPAPPDGSS